MLESSGSDREDLSSISHTLPKSSLSNALFIAADGGPREALRPVAEHCGSPLLDVQDERAERDEYWAGLFSARHPGLLLVGTSDSAGGRRIEATARRTAAHMGIPIAAIEDFPGNYYDVPDGGIGLLVVESEFSQVLNARKFGELCPPIVVVPPARYDPYRVQLAELRHGTAARWAQSAGADELVLWAGQPETDDAVNTLRAVLPLLRDYGATVLFKAHPRDPGYRLGVYPGLFASAGVRYRDITAYTVTQALELAPRLVITQFSSVAIEAGFFGVPGLHLLFASAGGTRLKQKKGYLVPPLCLAGGAAGVTEEALLATALARALHDEDFRAKLIGCFDEYYGTGELATPRLIETVGRFASWSK